MSDHDRRILRLAIPSILTALSTPLIGIADTAMIGHLPEVAFMGAVSTANLIFNAVFWCLADGYYCDGGPVLRRAR